MKLAIAFLTAAAVAGVSANVPPIQGDIHATSSLGKKLLSSARRVEENDAEEEEMENEWVAGYSLKFQGCHHIMQFNQNADDDEDVRLATKRLVRFRLCPSESCQANKAAGCRSGYGDYILDLSTFMNAFYENKKEQEEYKCEQYKDNNCNCDDDDAEDEEDEYDGEDGDEDCEYKCYMDAGMDYCIQDEDDGDGFDIGEYMACAQFDGAEEEEEDDEDRKNRRRKLDEDVAHYIGPYCDNQGGAVKMGLFLDDTCTEFADDGNGADTFYELTGESLPFSKESVVSSECISCVEAQNEDDYDDDAVSEMCEDIYNGAGKCEQRLPSGMTEENNNACNYMEGIKIVREDGMVTKSARPSRVATFFIVLFACLFAALVFYVWYLRMRLGVKNTAVM